MSGFTNALVDAAVARITETSMSAAPATLTGNSLTAKATVNRSDTTVSGALPVGYVSAATGSIDVGYAAATGITDLAGTGSAATTASVNLNTYQTSLDASSNSRGECSGKRCPSSTRYQGYNRRTERTAHLQQQHPVSEV